MSRESWWGSRDHVSNRLKLEVEMMRATFADTFRLVVPRRGDLYWTGDIEINLRGIPERMHTLRIVYVEGYPNRPAEAYVDRRRFTAKSTSSKTASFARLTPKMA
jgi:hypothetical protein